MSTYEAVVQALAILEGETITEPLLDFYRRAVDRMLLVHGQLKRGDVYGGVPYPLGLSRRTSPLNNSGRVRVGRGRQRDGHADVVFGGGPGGGPRVRLFDGAKMLAAGAFQTLDDIATAAQLANFFAGDPALRGGVRTELRSAGTGRDELVVGSGEGEHSEVNVFLSANLLAALTPNPDQTIDLFGVNLLGGVFVG
jgi:hypothetical protein